MKQAARAVPATNRGFKSINPSIEIGQPIRRVSEWRLKSRNIYLVYQSPGMSPLNFDSEGVQGVSADTVGFDCADNNGYIGSAAVPDAYYLFSRFEKVLELARQQAGSQRS